MTANRDLVTLLSQEPWEAALSSLKRAADPAVPHGADVVSVAGSSSGRGGAGKASAVPAAQKSALKQLADTASGVFG